jgi:pilus assembly protein CpaD
MRNRNDIVRHIASMLCIAAGIALAGCSQAPVGAIDYRKQHPIAAQERVFSLFVPVSVFYQEDAGAHERSINGFAADYRRRGRGPFLISQAGGLSGNQSPIIGKLMKAGVPRHKIFFQRRAGNQPNRETAELSYTGYTITVPTCGDWSGQAGFDPSNQSHTDFGCSVQRNTGLMLSNPGDLSVAGDPVERDAPTSDRLIRTFRDGKPIGTPAPVLEQKEFSDIK